MKPEPLTYTVSQVLELIPISRATLYREIATGKIETFHIGRRILIAPDALTAYLARRS